MQLSDRQKRQFFKQGYCLIRKLISRDMTERALQAINHSLGSEGMDKDGLPILRSQTYCPELTETGIITDLVNATDLAPVTESLLGKGNLDRQTYGQIALRFPQATAGPPPAPSGHIDGLGSGLNGRAVGDYARHFTCFAVVYLHDVLEPNCGNFTVWPGSHRVMEDYVRDKGLDILSRGQPSLDWPHAPVQIRGRAGDVCLVHHQTVHAGAPNISPRIRYAIIFRLRHVKCAENGLKSITDIWLEYPGLRSMRRQPPQVQSKTTPNRLPGSSRSVS